MRVKEKQGKRSKTQMRFYSIGIAKDSGHRTDDNNSNKYGNYLHPKFIYT
jgi:hypothetical protein